MADVRRASASIGGTTVAFEQQAGAESSQVDVCVADAARPDDPATCLTADGASMMNRTPDVSPDGSTVVFTKCLTTGLACDVYAARRGADGTWGAPVRLTDDAGEHVQAVTDGTLVAYASNAGGDWDIRWANVDGTGADQLLLPGSTELRPRISGGVISFESEPAGTPADLYAYRPATDDLFRLSDTPADETLNDLSVSPSGELRMVWAQPDGTALGSNDVFSLHAQLPREQNEPPVVQLPGPITVNATGPDGATVTFAATASDDGTATVTCEPASGATFAIGVTTVNCTATDDDGATATGAFDVTVRGAREQLADLLVAVTGVGPGHTLAAKIRSLVDRLPDRMLPATCEPLRLFIRQVEAQSGRAIPADQAAQWVADATRIRAVLACR
jgi:hypothetical protein